MSSPYDINSESINVPQGKERSREGKRRSPLKIFLLVFLIIIFLGVVGFGVYEYLRIAPRDVRFTNVTSSSVTVSWNTKSPTSGTALVFEGDTWLPITVLGLGGERFYDTRDVRVAELEAAEKTAMNWYERDGLHVSMDDFEVEVRVENMGEYYTHHVTVSSLNPETEYSFMIGDRFLYRRVSGDGVSTVTTLEIPENIEAPVPAYGSVYDAENIQAVPVEQLNPVADGIVYFNYLDENTEERSVAFSTPLNEEGNWYIDVSLLENFVYERLDQGTLWAELTMDLGQLGIWRKKVDIDLISPVEMVTINDPLIHNDAELGVEIVEAKSLTNLVKKVEAQSACMFVGFCGPCCQFKVSGGACEKCSCDSAILEARKCKGESTKDLQTQLQENASKVNPEPTAIPVGGTTAAKDLSEGEPCFLNNVAGTAQISPYGNLICVTSRASSTSTSIPTQKQGTDSKKIERGDDCNDPRGCYYEGQDGTLINVEYQPVQGSEELSENEVVIEPESGVSEQTLSTAQTCFEKGVGTSLYIAGEDGKPYDCYKGQVRQQDLEAAISGVNQDSCIALAKGESNTCSGGVFTNEYCYVQTGTMYYCSSKDREWKPVTAEAENVRVAFEPGEVSPGFPCDNPNGCLCPGSVLSDGILSEGIYCQQVSSAGCESVIGYEGRVCKEDRVKYTCQNSKCSPAPNVEGIQDQSKSTLERIFNKVLSPAYSSSQSSTVEYILDSETGMITGITSGLYLFEYEGQTYAFHVMPNEESLFVYLDKNNNGQYDEGIDIKISDIASQINIVALSRAHNYQLKEGFNFVSFPFLIPNEEFRTAAGLLKQLNEVYGDIIFSISRYDGGRWKIVGQNTILYSNDDFQLLPGQGYVIKARRNVSISIQGQPVKYDAIGDKAPIALFEGWNLIGLYGTGVKTYTAKTMIADINASNFTAVNVSKWEKEKQSYEGFQFSEGQEYGFDFPINQLESYFVRIKEGRGNWQPKLKTQ